LTLAGPAGDGGGPVPADRRAALQPEPAADAGRHRRGGPAHPRRGPPLAARTDAGIARSRSVNARSETPPSLVPLPTARMSLSRKGLGALDCACWRGLFLVEFFS